MFNYQHSLTSSNNHTPNSDPTSYQLGRSNFGLSDNNSRSLGFNLNNLPTDSFNFGPSNQIIPLGQPRFNQQLTEVRKTVITPHGIQIHTVVDISAPAMLPRINQNPFWDGSVSLRAPPPNTLPFINQNFVENVNLQIPAPNWQARNITSIPNVSVGPVLDVEPIQSYRSNDPTLHVPQYVPNMNNQENLANMNGLLNELNANLQSLGSTSRTPTIATKVEPDLVPQQEFYDKAEDSEEMEDDQDDDDNDADDGRTHSLPHQKHGPYTCPKCKRVFPISQSFASHVLGHYKRETPAERRRRYIAKYKNKSLQLTQSPHGLTVAHKPFKESNYGVDRPRKNTNQGITIEFTPVENRAQSLKHPQFDMRRPSTSGSTVIVKEEISG